LYEERDVKEGGATLQKEAKLQKQKTNLLNFKKSDQQGRKNSF